MLALEPGHDGGPAPIYASGERERIFAKARREPEREKDGTAEWSLMTLGWALRRAPDGLPEVSTYTIWKVLREEGFSWQRSRSCCETGKVKRKPRKSGEVVEVTDPDQRLRYSIEQAYRESEKLLGLSVWSVDQADPYQTIPYPGASWQMEGGPARQPHQHIRNGTAKRMTLFGRGRCKRGRKLPTRCSPCLKESWRRSSPSCLAKLGGDYSPPRKTASYGRAGRRG